MNAKVIKFAVPLLIVVLAILGAFVMSKARKPPEKVSEAKAALLVEVQPVVRQDVVYHIESQGAVTPKTETSLVSEVNGRIVRVADDFVEGGFFNAGDVLVQVEPADYQTSVKAAEAALANAQAALEEEKARVKVAEEDWRSFQAGTAPQLGLRRPQLASALAKVRSAEADLDRAKRDLARTEIRAPYAGMVKNRAVDLGQFVSRGTSIGVIYGTDVAEVRLPLTDNDLAYLELPKPNQAGAKPEVLLEAVVAAVGPAFPVLIDGGFRRGSDVLKAIALGARMVLVGRPFNYAAAVAGEAGVQHAIGLLRDEVDRNLAMLGASACTDLGPEHIVRRCS